MTWIDTHNKDATIRKYRLYYIGLAVPAYWTDGDINVAWDGNVWVAASISAGTVNQQPTGAVASFKIADADGSIFTALGAQDGGELLPGAIYEAFFDLTNETNVPDDVVQLFSGLIDRSVIQTANEDTVEITLMPPVTQQQGTLPLRLVSSLVKV